MKSFTFNCDTLRLRVLNRSFKSPLSTSGFARSVVLLVPSVVLSSTTSAKGILMTYYFLNYNLIKLAHLVLSEDRCVPRAKPRLPDASVLRQTNEESFNK